MTDRKKQLLGQQLRAQAEGLIKLEGSQLSQSIVDSCNALLAVASGIPVTQIGEMELQDLQAGYMAMAQMVIQFYHAVEQRLDVQADEQAMKKVIQELQTQQDKITLTENELKENKNKVEQLRISNDALQAEVESYKKEFEELNRAEEVLSVMKKKYTPEILEKQKAKNDNLWDSINTNKEELKFLLEKEETMNSENHLVQPDIPEVNKQLLREYEEKNALLEQLKTAEVECSEEEQQKLQEQIDQLLPVAQKLESAYTIMQDRLDDLEERNTYYDRENQILSTNVIEKLQAAAAELEPVVTEYKELLETVKKQADTLASNVEKCAKLREDYANWFDVDETPLEAMIKKLNYSQEESEQLRTTLNPANVYQVKKLIDETRMNLLQLDKIKEKCVAAIRTDQKELLKMTRKQR